jgi:hypothetical protein
MGHDYEKLEISLKHSDLMVEGQRLNSKGLRHDGSSERIRDVKPRF